MLLQTWMATLRQSCHLLLAHLEPDKPGTNCARIICVAKHLVQMLLEQCAHSKAQRLECCGQEQKYRRIQKLEGAAQWSIDNETGLCRAITRAKLALTFAVVKT